ncbi:UDP-N-acetylmuramoyl-L-alanyl-D-glutamate--2,6-diaminopimelate ligase [Thalassoglobus sp. JC818]|uniref:UDP-N-acetylmuramoyl-L-alanyl-D-glutamate--2, 6-diaminopimelate ligase n=1 Tax=Thalassoglobus sp. JC818 TaxID=3232136 RepID=UPI003457EC74
MLIPHRQPGAVNLRKEIPLASFVGCPDITVSEVAAHTDDCTPGCLFVTLPGTQSHGRDHIPLALQRGVAAILTDYPLADISLPQCIVPDVRKAYGQLCHAMYGHPSRRMGIAGVTGTNGKTTTTWILRSLLQSASRSTGLIGTIEYNDGVHSEPSTLTTPDAMTTARLLAAMRDRQTNYAAIELSSHALAQGRPEGLGLDVAVITNVTHDHLDYHESLDQYIAAKAKIIDYLKPEGILIVNTECPHWEKFIPEQERRVRVLSFGATDDADIFPEILELSSSGSRFRMHYGVERFDCEIPLTGKHNVSNAAAAACAALHLGLTTEEIQAGLAKCPPVPGRLESVNCGQNFSVYVDYAHTDDAIQHAIQTVRPLTSGQTTIVFGAGGERDRFKRRKMAVAAAAADKVIVTSDNPRGESPEQIIEDIMEGFASTSVKPIIEIDRRKAIQRAISEARGGDAVLVAGKGHERFQIVGNQRLPFDDVAVCREAIQWNFRTLHRVEATAKVA